MVDGDPTVARWASQDLRSNAAEDRNRKKWEEPEKSKERLEKHGGRKAPTRSMRPTSPCKQKLQRLEHV